MKVRNHFPVVLLLSASDPEGSLGIQSDISVLSSMKRRVFVSTVVTSYVIRQPNGRVRLRAVPADVLRSQLHTAIETFHPDVVKIGWLADAVSVCEVAAILRKERFQKIVYSPEFEDERERSLLSDDTMKAVCCHLMPIVRLLVVSRRSSDYLLKAKEKGKQLVETMTDVQLSRYLISTFHCSCYLSVPTQSDILALERELFYYRPVGRMSGKQKVEKEKETAVRNVKNQMSGTPVPVRPTCSVEKQLYNKVSQGNGQGDTFRRFSSAVAGYWTSCQDMKKSLYEAKLTVHERMCRASYLNENHAAAPYYPLTDGGNYE